MEGLTVITTCPFSQRSRDILRRPVALLYGYQSKKNDVSISGPRRNAKRLQDIARFLEGKEVFRQYCLLMKARAGRRWGDHILCYDSMIQCSFGPMWQHRLSIDRRSLSYASAIVSLAVDPDLARYLFELGFISYTHFCSAARAQNSPRARRSSCGAPDSIT